MEFRKIKKAIFEMYSTGFDQILEGSFCFEKKHIEKKTNKKYLQNNLPLFECGSLIIAKIIDH